MAVATTFGTAATGTAISTLSGAAATNAALAWLGGGALTVGGAGMAGGEGLLALAGPVGWGIAAVGLVGGGLLTSGKNKQNATKLNAQVAKVNSLTDNQKALNVEVKKMKKLTIDDMVDTKSRVNLVDSFPRDFGVLNEEQVTMMGTLVNNCYAATQHLNAVLGESGEFSNK